ncbi:MAG: phosphoribosylaminoimidazolesuccinocarboxamide synthase [Candidatus Omnitrophota bacterium]|nr:MAG: phosphoribosylaminoimidazolesuccinocarboxamide synthase [Candidatus Omnitrophota bacterium]
MKKSLAFLNLEGLKLYKRGKVRDIFEVGSNLLIVSTDRISCFDVVLPDPIPLKGVILNQLSVFWFNFTKDIIENHLLTDKIEEMPQEVKRYKDLLEKRVMLVKKTKPIPIECVVRGYLEGSAWREYKEKGEACGEKLPSGLKKGDRLPQPLFTPATKEEKGHDINIAFSIMESKIGKENAQYIKRISLEIYKKASLFAERQGIIVVDTKFEFGIEGEKIILIDEVLTPDSSRFWPKEEKVSLDKQFVRDYLESVNWNKKEPAPHLPLQIIAETQKRYEEIYKKITGLNIDEVI